jgi:hypothetical protein
MVNARFIAKTMSVLLFLFWGLFFVEHLSWFASVPSKVPPASVWMLSLLHLFLLVSYALSLRWERTGCAGIVICSTLFFSLTARYNALPFIIVSISPAMIFFYIWKKEQGKAHEEQSV